MRLARIAMVSLMVALCCLPAYAKKKKPPTAEGKASFIEKAKLIEEEPLSEKAPSYQKDLIMWWSETAGIDVKWCLSLLGKNMDTPKSDLMWTVCFQLLFSSIAYSFSNPEEARNPVSLYCAGLEGALKTYENILKEKPEVRDSNCDNLVKARELGLLRRYVEAHIADCQ